MEASPPPDDSTKMFLLVSISTNDEVLFTEISQKASESKSQCTETEEKKVNDLLSYVKPNERLREFFLGKFRVYLFYRRRKITILVNFGTKYNSVPSSVNGRPTTFMRPLMEILACEMPIFLPQGGRINMNSRDINFLKPGFIADFNSKLLPFMANFLGVPISKKGINHGSLSSPGFFQRVSDSLTDIEGIICEDGITIPFYRNMRNTSKYILDNDDYSENRDWDYRFPVNPTPISEFCYSESDDYSSNNETFVSALTHVSPIIPYSLSLSALSDSVQSTEHPPNSKRVRSSQFSQESEFSQVSRTTAESMSIAFDEPEYHDQYELTDEDAVGFFGMFTDDGAEAVLPEADNSGSGTPMSSITVERTYVFLDPVCTTGWGPWLKENEVRVELIDENKYGLLMAYYINRGNIFLEMDKVKSNIKSLLNVSIFMVEHMLNERLYVREDGYCITMYEEVFRAAYDDWISDIFKATEKTSDIFTRAMIDMAIVSGEEKVIVCKEYLNFQEHSDKDRLIPVRLFHIYALGRMEFLNIHIYSPVVHDDYRRAFKFNTYKSRDVQGAIGTIRILIIDDGGKDTYYTLNK